MLKNEYPYEIKYIGKTSKLTMINSKIYNARDCGKGWFALIDETGEEYAYPPELFEMVENVKHSPVKKTIYRKLPENSNRKDESIAVAGK